MGGKGVSGYTYSRKVQLSKKIASIEKRLTTSLKKRLARVKSEVPADYEELKSKAQKFDELEEANKTELQKATEQLEKLKSDIAKRDEADKLRAIKAQVSKDTGVPAELISGANEDEMKEFAEKIAKFAKKDSAPALDHAGKFASATKENSSAARDIARQINN